MSEYPVYRAEDIAAALPPEDARKPKDERPRVISINGDDRIRRARAYARSIPPAVEGQNGDNDTFRAACKTLRGFALTEDECFAILSEEFNRRCVPPWTESDLRQKIRNALRYGQQPAGMLLHESHRNRNGNSHTEAPTQKYEEARERLGCIRVADVETEHVEWLWHPRIALGKLTDLDGDPGLGKSTLSWAIATHVTRGHGLPGVESCTPGRVVLLSAEDGIGDTIKPKLDAMSADCTMITAVSKHVTLDTEGCTAIHHLLTVEQPRLVIIDPLFAYTGSKVDIHRANETRAIMDRLSRLAAHHHCAIICIRHLTKSGRDKSIYRGVGSIDITAAWRSVLLVGADPADRRRRALVQIKNNLAPLADPVGFSLEAGAFAWTGKTDLSAGEMLANEEEAAQSAGALRDAKEFLQEILANGPVLHEQVIRESRQAGISERSLYRAKAELHVKSSKNRGHGKWQWSLL